jgi:hypothetical protein
MSSSRLTCGVAMVEEGIAVLYAYSIRPKISVAFASREITLTKNILKNINIYDT